MARINRLTNEGPLRELRVGTLPVCESWLEGKMTRRPFFSAKGERAKKPLELVHTDVYLMQRKSETFGKLKAFVAEAKN